MILIVMGVCGSGKSTIAEFLAEKLSLPFIEGDTLHSEANVAKMASGTPLTEADRQPWLRRIREACDAYLARGETVIATCSALSQNSREVLGVERDEVILLYPHAPESVLAERLVQRKDHFMPPGLLASQLEALEVPSTEEAIHLDVSRDRDVVIAELLDRLRQAGIA